MRLLFIAVAAFSSTFLPASEALGIDVRTGGCALVSEWEFSPPLTSSTQSGTVEISSQYVCSEAGVKTDPIGVPNTVGIDVGEGSMQYAGNCHAATLTTSRSSMLLLEGSVGLYTSNTTLASTALIVLIPDEICNQASAMGPTVSFGAVAN